MDITILKPPVDGKIEVTVKYYEQIDGLGHDATLTVWITNTDSRAELAHLARAAAVAFLRRCLSAHSG